MQQHASRNNTRRVATPGGAHTRCLPPPTTQAPEFFKEALKYDDAHEKALLALSKIYLNNGELSNCQNQCATLLRIDPGNKEGLVVARQASRPGWLPTG